MAELTGGIQEWQKNLNAEDRVVIQRQLVRLHVKTLAQPASGRYINCKNVAGRTVMKIYPDHIVFGPGCGEDDKQQADGQPLSAFQPKPAKAKSKAALEIQVESPGICQSCFLQLPLNGRCACDE